MFECLKCKVVVSRGCQLIKCSECNGLIHLLCTDLSIIQKFNKDGDEENVSWVCDKCVSLSTASNRPEDGIAVVPAATKEILKIDQSHTDLADKVEANTSDFAKQDTASGISQEQVVLKEEINSLRMEIQYLREELQMMWREVRELQQYTRRENLEIVGVPFTKNEDVYEIVDAVAKCLEIFHLRSHVSVAHRLFTKTKHPTIIVRFVAQSTRDAWLAVARKDTTKSINTKDIHPSLAAGSVFIYEHLSPYKKMLLSWGEKLVMEKKLAYAWARGGKIFIKKTPFSKAVRVHEMKDFEDA